MGKLRNVYLAYVAFPNGSIRADVAHLYVQFNKKQKSWTDDSMLKCNAEISTAVQVCESFTGWFEGNRRCSWIQKPATQIFSSVFLLTRCSCCTVHSGSIVKNKDLMGFDRKCSFHGHWWSFCIKCHKNSSTWSTTFMNGDKSNVIFFPLHQIRYLRHAQSTLLCFLNTNVFFWNFPANL